MSDLATIFKNGSASTVMYSIAGLPSW